MELWTLILAAATLLISGIGLVYNVRCRKKDQLQRSKDEIQRRKVIEAKLKALDFTMRGQVSANEMGTLFAQKFMLEAELEELKKE